jgi:hypothetical protein
MKFGTIWQEVEAGSVHNSEFIDNYHLTESWAFNLHDGEFMLILVQKDWSQLTGSKFWYSA